MLLSSSASINRDGLRLEFAYANDGRCKKGTTDLCLFFYISALLPKELQRVGDLDVSDAVLEVADARQVTQLLYDDGRELTRRTLKATFVGSRKERYQRCALRLDPSNHRIFAGDVCIDSFNANTTHLVIATLCEPHGVPLALDAITGTQVSTSVFLTLLLLLLCLVALLLLPAFFLIRHPA